MIDDRNTWAAGELAGNFDRVLDGLGTGVQQDRLFREVARCVLGEQFAEAHV